MGSFFTKELTGKKFNKENPTAKYMILTNKEEKVENCELKNGMNLFPFKRDPNGNRESDGILFASTDIMLKLVSENDNWYRMVSIPDDAKIHKVQNFFYADKIILYKREYIWTDTIACSHIISHNAEMIRYVENQTHNMCLFAVSNNGYLLRHVKEKTYDICLKAIQMFGATIKNIGKNTFQYDTYLELCFAAINNDAYALFSIIKLEILTDDDYIKLCLIAVKKNGSILQHIKKQTEEICLAAVKSDPDAIHYVEIMTDKLRIASMQSQTQTCF